MAKRNFTRRHFLNLLVTTLSSYSLLGAAAHANEQPRSMQQFSSHPDEDKPKIGIALGAGGANGLAHILMLEALDEMNIKPHRISGSSIGAIIGALYASGMTGQQIRQLVEQFIISPEERLVEEFFNKDALRWIEFLEIDLGNGALLNSEGFISFLYEELKSHSFETLRIPLKITAADLWSGEQIVLHTGELLPAIKASMALPGVFPPVELENRALIDGGTVNPVPYDLLSADCDIVIAIDVSGERTRPETLVPGYFETLFNSVKVMQQAIMTEKLRHNEPEIYIAPHIVDIRVLEFYRAREVFSQALPAKEELKKRLSKLFET